MTWSSFAESFRIEGAFWMWIIVPVSIACVAIMIERFFFLYFKYNIQASAFFSQIQKLVMAGNIDRAIKLCNAAPSSALARVIKAGLIRANKGPEAVSDALEEATLEITPIVTKRTNALLGLANIATLLGLLGTIVGLISAFAALENAAPEDRQRLLAAGISLAMYTTAFGLIVAIPTMLVHMFLAGLTKRILDEVDHYSVKLTNILSAGGSVDESAE
jgi:biopolymer transport protein ExbB